MGLNSRPCCCTAIYARHEWNLAAAAVGGNVSSMNPDDRDDRVTDRVQALQDVTKFVQRFGSIQISPTFAISSGALGGSVK